MVTDYKHISLESMRIIKKAVFDGVKVLFVNTDNTRCVKRQKANISLLKKCAGCSGNYSAHKQHKPLH